MCKTDDLDCPPSGQQKTFSGLICVKSKMFDLTRIFFSPIHYNYVACRKVCNC